jgi:protein-disulfide isomerase
MSTSTPSRKEQRDAARAERKRQEEEAALHARRKRRLLWVGGGLIGLIVVVAVVAIVASGGGSSSSSSSTASGSGGVAKAAFVKNQYAGIPQKGNVLGSNSAPATMMVFADLQCPFCGEFERGAFPSIVSRYVKDGKLKVVFQPISIVGNDSVTAAHAVAAAALQNKGFDYASLFYENQGQENTGYVTEGFLTNLAKATPGLNVAKWKADLGSAKSSALLSRAQSASQAAQVNSTPTFLVGKTGQPLSQLNVTSLEPQAFYGKLDSLTQ